MKYQVIISKLGKLRPRQSGPVSRSADKCTVLKPHLLIGDAAFWQHRIQEIADDLSLNEYTTVRVAK